MTDPSDAEKNQSGKSEEADDLPARILIVDDDEDCRLLCGKVLKAASFEVELAGSGQEALDIAPAFMPDLIILDIMMPGMDGFEVVRRLRQESRFETIPVIMLTARRDMDDKLRGFDEGANDYVVKPFSTDELLSRTRSFVSTARRQRRDLEMERFEVLRQTAAAVAHRLNNPLQTIMTAVEMLRDESPGDQEFRKQTLTLIHDKLVMMGDLINRLNRTTRVVSRPYVGNEKMIDIEESAPLSEADGLPDFDT